MKIPYHDIWTNPVHIEIVRGRVERGEYEKSFIINRVVDHVLADLGLDDADDQTRMAEDAEGWIE